MFAGDTRALGDYGPLTTAAGDRLSVIAIKPAGDSAIVKFVEITDRSKAEALAGSELYVARSALPEPQDEDEFYHHDLIGLTANRMTGETIGTVIAVHNFGAGDILEIDGAKGPVMVIFEIRNVPKVDLKTGTITVVIPEETVANHE